LDLNGEPRLQSLGLADLAQLGRTGEGQTVLQSYAQSALHLALTRLVSQRTTQRVGWVLGSGNGHLGGLNPQIEEHSDRQGGGVLAARLQSAGYTIEPLDLRQPAGDRPRPAVWLIPGGGQAWTPAEIEQLAQHLRTGGRGLILVERRLRDQTPGQGDSWQSVWSELGLRVGADRVVALDHLNTVVPVVTTQPPSPGSTPAASLSSASRSTLPATLRASPADNRAMPGTGGRGARGAVNVFEAVSVRSLLTLEDHGVVATPLLCSDPAPRSWAESDLAGPPQFDPATDLPGPVCVAMAVERAAAGRHDPMAIVVGDAEFLSNSGLTSPAGQAGFAWTVACLDWLTADNPANSPIPPQLFSPIARPSSARGPRRVLWTFGLVWGAACLSFAAARSRS
ncbi:MAG: hypothetical protein ACKOJF_05085, partial [Planctomycetaceae bacterium]